MYRPIRKLLTTLLLGIILGLPTLAIADHMHNDFGDEVNCELCNASAQAAASAEPQQQARCTDSKKRQEKRTRLPFEVFRLNEYQRGPPLLR